MNTQKLYVCGQCGKQMLKLDSDSLLKTFLLIASGYAGYEVFVLNGTCEECAAKQQILVRAGAAVSA